MRAAGSGVQGSSLKFMQQQHLDPNNVTLGILCPLSLQGFRNLDLGAALARATNDWQVAECPARTKRLRASWWWRTEDAKLGKGGPQPAGDKNLRRCLMSRNTSRSVSAATADLSGGRRSSCRSASTRSATRHQITRAVWPSSISRRCRASQCQQSALAAWCWKACSKTLPELKVISIEAGFGWVQFALLAVDSISTGCAASCRI